MPKKRGKAARWEDVFPRQLQKLSDRFGGQGELADCAGISRKTINNYLKRRTRPDLEKVVQIAEATGASLAALLEGGSTTPVDLSLASDNWAADGYVAVPRYEDLSPTQQGKEGSPIVDLLIRQHWLGGSFEVEMGDLVAVQARGDSMSRTINHGDLLLVDRREALIGDAGVYMISVDDHEAVLARIHRPHGTRAVRVSNDNPRYPEVLDIGEADVAGRLHVIGKVVWRGARFDHG